MTNRRFELFEYRQVLVRMRQGDSDRDIARAGLMGRKKLTAVRRTAQELGWLDPAQPLPQDTVIADKFGRTPHAAPAQYLRVDTRTLSRADQ